MKDDKKNYLILGSHAHVPSGAPESEFEFVYENKMRPFVTNLYRYSNIQAVFHYSGILLYWVERNHPELFMLIEDMISRKQAEILGGGFYEPCFPLIPLQDRIGQIELMTTYLRKHFGKRPQGCWLPGFVWEQHLVTALSLSDMNYSFLSQEQFSVAGLQDEQIFFPCITEDQGKLIVIFPVSSSIEKELEDKSFYHVFNELNKEFENKSNLPDKSEYFLNTEKIICIFPDKVSSSPEEAVDTAWNRFFEEISLSENIIETTLPSKIIKKHKSLKKNNFPDSAKSGNDFSPRRFLINHEEANSIYSKMIFTNVLINQLKGDKARKQNAREELWKAQDSCFFSPCNGHLRGELRKAAYSSLLRAERLSRENVKAISSLVQHDFDLDGVKEYLFQNDKINCYVHKQGAGIFELDYFPNEWNYLDCGTNEYGRRTAFADIIACVDEKTDESFNLSSGNSRLCFTSQYEAQTQDRKGKSCFILSSCSNEPFGSIEINKCYLLKKDSLQVSYALRNTGKVTQVFQFIPEIDFSFAGAGDEYVRFYAADSDGKDINLDGMYNTNNLKIHDIINEVQIILLSDKEYTGRLLTAFNGDHYQATRIIPSFFISLESGEIWINEFTLIFSH
ncbi:MAG: DUF1926 domain-containing protein [Treponema sp.]|nr:DUF1926 domain-containing protein [Treponema sp.]